jgi:hypothetical protein
MRSNREKKKPKTSTKQKKGSAAPVAGAPLFAKNSPPGRSK